MATRESLKITRRKFLAGTTSLVLISGGILTIKSNKSGRTIDLLFPSKTAMTRLKLEIGKVKRFAKTDLALVNQKINEEFDFGEVSQLSTFIENEIKSDFASKRVLRIAGWNLSEFECKIFELYG